ncbi:MAG TPA: RNA polymerase sigma factor [Puia sp.]|jgi:RNA polymerase sigma-70 factor (ECF subfamily)|nr:RNA polymerase sigma factor [Puia sp.]
MQQVRDGQLSELTELFERYHVRLYNFFLRLTLDKAVSEDLTQNLWHRVLRYRQSFEPASGSFRSWVYRMARNIYSDHLRQEQRVPGGVKGDEEAEQIAGPPAEWSGERGEGYTEDQFERLDAAMANLSPDQREILVLSRYQGLKYDEISKIKEISVPAIKVQVFRALRQLRALYFKK